MFEFELPDLGEGVAEGEILAWHVSPGDRVEEDQVLAEVETDKAAVDVPSPVAGLVRELHYEPGDMVETGTVFVTIAPDEDVDERSESTDSASGEGRPASSEAESSESASGETASSVDGTDGETATTSGTSAAGGRVFAPPNVRRLARELGVEITAVEGSGPSGRITEGDVRAAAEDDEESEVKSAVSRVDGDGEDEPQVKSAVRRVGSGSGQGDAPQGADDGQTAVKSAVSTADSTAERDQTLATPATRKIARDLGVDVDALPTDQSRDGQPYVDEAAVRAFAASAEELEEGQASGAAVAETAETEPAITDREGEDVTAAAGERREPYQGIRRTIGQRMAQSRREVPHATHHDRAVVEGLVDARERLEPLAEERDVRLTYTPLLLKCVAAALREHPILNSELDTEAEEIVFHDAVHLGVATATDHGLVVPVVEHVDEKGLLEIAREVNDLVARARERDLAREEMQGGTFTVTNFGAIGGEYADPIINVPQTAILGTGALKERPVASEGEVVAKPTLPLSLAIDHRVIDGADAARFVNTLKEYLAEPRRLLLE
jgi:pyruvate dehydrogenase E2 component (dihydrolipoamide acetyltransferase)